MGKIACSTKKTKTKNEQTGKRTHTCYPIQLASPQICHHGYYLTLSGLNPIAPKCIPSTSLCARACIDLIK